MIIQFFFKFALDKRFWVEKSNEIFVDILQLYTDGDFWMNSAWVITLVHKILNVTDGGKNFLL